MADPLAEVEFLARSHNRIEILATLAADAYTRRELGDAVDASQPTIGRVLNDLSERGWVDYDGERYAATVTGAYVADGITALRDRLATETRLRPIVDYFPTAAVDVGLDAFADASITTPSTPRPNAPIERMTELLAATDRARLVSHAFNRDKLELLHERAGDGSVTVEGVFAREAIDAIAADDRLAALLGDLLSTPDTEIRVTDEEIPFAVELTDDRTHFLLRDEAGVVRGSLDTADQRVREWAETAFRRYWENASQVSAGDIQSSVR
ncbi:helix-turn-helix transcriptional regulator [Halosegnis sp.]|uniref:helix-turn-helix transcriptional regulator n=1 Tax=Halosegnis sp. TaxID=2864959 RepID=UPI0035D4A6AD